MNRRAILIEIETGKMRESGLGCINNYVLSYCIALLPAKNSNYKLPPTAKSDCISRMCN